MSERQGSLLEKQIATIFSSSGFETENNVKIAGYEIDVHAEMGDLEIVIECKQYENSHLNVRNRIHEWQGKNKSVDADIVVLAVYGQEIKDEEKQMAKDKGMRIWDKNIIQKLMNKEPEERKNFIFSNLPIEKKEDLGKSYKKDIQKLVWKPYLEGDKVNNDYSYEQLLFMVKQRVRRELYQKGSTKPQRRQHIEIFENVTRKGLIRSNISVKDSEERFKKIEGKISENNTALNDSKEEKYSRYLKSVHKKYLESKKYYLQSNGQKQVRRLVESRLEHLMKYGGEVEFSPRARNKPITASRQNGKISLNFQIKNAGDLENIRWILTREGSKKVRENENGRRKVAVSFRYQDVDEAVDATVRIMDEYYGFDLESIRIVDKKKDDLQRGKSLFSELLSR